VEPEDVSVSPNAPFHMTCAAVGPPEPVTIVWWMGDSRVGLPDISPSILNVSGKAAANAGDHFEHQKRRALFWSCLVTLGNHIVWESSLTVRWGLRVHDHIQSRIILRGDRCSACFLLASGTQALAELGWGWHCDKDAAGWVMRWVPLLFHLVEGLHHYINWLCWWHLAWKSPSIHM